MNKNSYFIQKIEALLRRESTSSEGKTYAKLVAEKSVLFNHLYEDIGFSSRNEMNEFMSTHFQNLASKKPKNIRWKKYLYDCIDEVAPACVGCPDEDICFSCKG